MEHNHGKNFGRYVDGCPRCIELHPEGKPVRKAKAAVAKAPEVAVGDMATLVDLVKALLLKQGGGNADAMETVAKLMLQEKTEAFQEKQATKERAEAAKAQMRADIEKDKANFLAHQMSCSHAFPNGNTAINPGQIHNDGFYHPRCYICMFEFPVRRATREEQPTVIEA
jgi:hypothetical protein